MNLRWYIAFLVVVLSVFGSLTTDEQTAIPNQEIVLEFDDISIDSELQENTVAFVKQQLQKAGSTEIQVQEIGHGLLKISYFSDSAVEEIKALLDADKSKSLRLSETSKDQRIPFDDQDVDYRLDVYEIQQSYELSDIEGQMTFETKWERDRSIHSNHYFTNSEDSDPQLVHNSSVAFKANTNVTIAIENRSRAIPEVRAGPII